MCTHAYWCIVYTSTNLILELSQIVVLSGDDERTLPASTRWSILANVFMYHSSEGLVEKVWQTFQARLIPSIQPIA